MDTAYDEEKYTRILVNIGDEESTGSGGHGKEKKPFGTITGIPAEGQAAAGTEEIGSDPVWFEPLTRVRRGHYMPTDDTWMDMSWATMSPDRMRNFPAWTPRILAVSETPVNYDRDFLFVQDDEAQGDEDTFEFGRAGLGYGRERNRSEGSGRRMWILLVVIIVGLLGAAFVFGQVKSRSEAEMYIENYMGR